MLSRYSVVVDLNGRQHACSQKPAVPAGGTTDEDTTARMASQLFCASDRTSCHCTGRMWHPASAQHLTTHQPKMTLHTFRRDQQHCTRTNVTCSPSPALIGTAHAPHRDSLRHTSRRINHKRTGRTTLHIFRRVDNSTAPAQECNLPT